MAAKIAAFLITLLINIAVGTLVFFGMLMGMNGYSESDATYGLITYIVLAILVSFLVSTLAAVAVHLLMKRQFGAAVAALIAIAVATVVGVVLKVVSCIIGIGVSEFVRVNF